MKKNFVILVLCCFVNKVSSQSLKELKIGDTLPQVKVTYLYGNSAKTTLLETFYKNNFLIIDFWADWCAACVKAMAAADSVTNKFNGKVSILPVTYQDSQTIGKFIEKNKILKSLNLKYVISDSILMGGYFKFVTLPHEVWIDKLGIVKAITYADEITEENINRFVNNKPLSLAEKVDDVNFDIGKPLDIENNNFLYRAILTSYKPGLSNIIGSLTPAFIKGSKEDRFLAVNKDILSMFYAAYSQSNSSINFDRVELNIRDSLKLSPFLREDDVPRRDIMKHCYCYELILPQKVLLDTFYNFLLQDLNKLFSFKASIEKRKKLCWVIINKTRSKNPKSPKTHPALVWEHGFIKTLKNQTMDVLTSYLNWNMNLPVLDETHFTEHFDMKLDLNAISFGKYVYLDIKKVRQSLQFYGFDLIKVERNTDVLIIRDK